MTKMAPTQIAWLLGLTVLLTPQVYSDDRADYGLEEKLRAFLLEHKLQSATVGLLQENKLVFAKELVRKSENEVNEEAAKLIPAMEMSHLISCLAVLNMEDDGFISLDEKLFGERALLHEYTNHLNMEDERMKDITILQVMQQTIGWGIRDMMWTYEDEPINVLTRTFSQRLSWAPGATYNYSVLNEYLIRRVIEVRSGLRYEAYVKEHILVPLGMYRTKMHVLKDSSIARLMDFTMPLLTKVWHMSVYDLIRLLSAIDGHPGLYSFNLNKLSIIYSRPAPPYPQTTQHWHSPTFLVSADGSYWSESVTSNGHYLFVSNTGTDATRRVDNRITDVVHKENTLFVVYVRGVSHKHFKPILADMVKEIKEWPAGQDLMANDLADSMHKATGTNAKISEHNLDAYMNAVRHAGYMPQWINAYSVEDITFFTVIFSRANATDLNNWVFEHGLRQKAFQRRIEKYEKVDIELALTQQYICHSHKDPVCYFILLRPKEESNVQSAIYHEMLAKVSDRLRSESEAGFTPVIITVPQEQDGALTTTVVFRKPVANAFAWYLAITEERLKSLLHTEASKKFYLTYLNVFTADNGDVLFVAGLQYQTNGQDWLLETVSDTDDVSTSVKLQMDEMAKTGYQPALSVAYANSEDVMQYMILYRRANEVQ